MSAAVMTYTTLAESILSYSERPNDTELTAQIPQLVLLAESDCAADLRVLGTELVVSSTLTANVASIAKPQFWRRTVSISVATSLSYPVPISGFVPLQKRTYEYLRNFWPDQVATGVPRFYAEYNVDNFLIAPTPDAAYPFELIYQARLEPLSAETQTNWFTSTVPQLLLYACMYHASLFLKNFTRAEMWKGQYDKTLEALKLEDGTRKYDRTTVEG